MSQYLDLASFPQTTLTEVSAMEEPQKFLSGLMVSRYSVVRPSSLLTTDSVAMSTCGVTSLRSAASRFRRLAVKVGLPSMPTMHTSWGRALTFSRYVPNMASMRVGCLPWPSTHCPVAASMRMPMPVMSLRRLLAMALSTSPTFAPRSMKACLHGPERARNQRPSSTDSRRWSVTVTLAASSLAFWSTAAMPMRPSAAAATTVPTARRVVGDVSDAMVGLIKASPSALGVTAKFRLTACGRKA
mmetsp:Transcript_43269/g.135469  ORF Transcript_43269/g.135469 Transcript_43269/m.135469 type:complete len:243 (+) Transcript_43269:520-1248(+)